MLDLIFTHFNYAVVIVLMMVGLYVIFATQNLIKKLAGLSVFQTSVFLLYITIGKVGGGQPPILVDSHGGDHVNSDGHCGGGCDPCDWSCAGCAYSRSLQYYRKRRD